MASGDVLRADLTGLPANYDLQVQQVTAIGIACNNSGPMITVEGSSTNSGTTDEVVVASPGWWFSDYMRVYSGGGFDATNTYTLKGVVTRPETTSPHNNTGNAQVLPEMVEFRVNGTTNFGGEHDYYRLSADSGETITADLPTGAVNHDVVILNSSGSTISSLGNSVSASATYTGVYYARVQRMTAGGTLSYQVHLGVN